MPTDHNMRRPFGQVDPNSSEAPSWLATGTSTVLWIATIAVVTIALSHHRPGLLIAAAVLFVLSFLPLLVDARRSGKR